ncbi:MAG: peptidylprolyl isomerase [Polyangiaceae bacterium]|nr:peptidylprolyl isomerase [Polyangiaceae bacterium]
MNASHILVAYAGAQRAKPEVTRTREEAQAQAEALLAELRAGADFAAVATRASDCPSAARGGALGTFRHKMMVRAFSDAVAALEIGQIGCVVETEFGFHIIFRSG